MPARTRERRATAQIDARLGMAFQVIYALLLWHAWGRWLAIAGIVACQAANVLAAVYVHPWRFRSSWRHAGDVVSGLHTTLNLLAAHLAGWSAPSWILLPAGMFASCAHHDRESRRFVAVLALAFAAVAALDGVAATTIAVHAAGAVALYIMWEGWAQLLRAALARVEDERGKLEAAQRTMVEQEKLASVGLLAAGVAHEVNNPMSYVTANLRQLARDLEGAAGSDPLLREVVREVLPDTLDGVQRVNTIVSDLLRFAREGDGALERFDVNEEVAAGVRIAQPRTKDRCAVELRLGAVPRILGHPQEIARVVVNLLVNAAQAARGRGHVRVETRAADGGVVLSVRDDGAGMTTETRAHLFEPFFTTKPVGEGTGLGLAVVHGIVRRHGGRIEVESAPGQGSAFTVWLPCSPPAERQPGAKAASHAVA